MDYFRRLISLRHRLWRYGSPSFNHGTRPMNHFRKNGNQLNHTQLLVIPLNVVVSGSLLYRTTSLSIPSCSESSWTAHDSTPSTARIVTNLKAAGRHAEATTITQMVLPLSAPCWTSSTMRAFWSRCRAWRKPCSAWKAMEKGALLVQLVSKLRGVSGEFRVEDCRMRPVDLSRIAGMKRALRSINWRVVSHRLYQCF